MRGSWPLTSGHCGDCLKSTRNSLCGTVCAHPLSEGSSDVQLRKTSLDEKTYLRINILLALKVQNLYWPFRLHICKIEFVKPNIILLDNTYNYEYHG